MYGTNTHENNNMKAPPTESRKVEDTKKCFSIHHDKNDKQGHRDG